MRYSMTFVEADYESLTNHLFVTRSVEQAAFLLCSRSLTASETRLLVRRVLPVAPEEVIGASDTHMEIAPQSFMRAMKQADALGLSFAFVHSHPDGAIGHSPQDDETERSLFRTAYTKGVEMLTRPPRPRSEVGAVACPVVQGDAIPGVTVEGSETNEAARFR